MSKAHRLVAGIATALLSLSLVACSGGGSVVTVNGQSISRSDFDQKLEASPTSRSVLQTMVTDDLLDQYAASHNITVTDGDIAKIEDQYKAQYPGDQWDQLLKARGLTENDVHDLIRHQVQLDKAVGTNIHVSEKQIADYFSKNRAQFDTPDEAQARHILVPDMATAEKIEGMLKKGGDFATLAKQYSVDPGSRDKGGELGWFRRGAMTPTFEAYVFSAPVGKISEPVKSPFGYHIIQVEARKMGKKATLASAHDQVADLLRQQQEAPLIQPFLQQLQSTAKIQVDDPAFASVFPSPAPAAPAPAPTK